MLLNCLPLEFLPVTSIIFANVFPIPNRHPSPFFRKYCLAVWPQSFSTLPHNAQTSFPLPTRHPSSPFRKYRLTISSQNFVLFPRLFFIVCLFLSVSATFCLVIPSPLPHHVHIPFPITDLSLIIPLPLRGHLLNRRPS